ncbi:MAG TPA: glycoside hydrolase 43 family protein [Verrucomicrobiae bacterium]|nr:glycoside hydrolase 43 family protein [Verrucomicrobiae bacterium]
MNSSLPSPSIQSPAGKNRSDWPHVADPGDGTFRNPILFADYSDPDVIRHGDDFYLTASSFNCTPGLPILHSRDLVNWTLIGHAIENLPHPRYSAVRHGCGIWAPSLRFHDGRFWIFFPMPDEGIYVVTAEHPAGPWSEPHLVQEGKGLIDPCPLWDDDGKAYLVHAFAHSRAGIKHQLRVCPMSPDGRKLSGSGKIVFHAPERHPTIEGPKFLKKDGWYYIFAPAGGVATGWQVALRSRNIYGPYEDRIVLEQGASDINGPHQGALVDTPNGQWWFFHFQDRGLYGRVVHLQPVEWREGWPLIGRDSDGNGIGEPVSECASPVVALRSAPVFPDSSDEFDSVKPGLQWQWHANHRREWFSLTARPGFLRLFNQPSDAAVLSDTPNLLLQKFPARSFTVETALEFFPENSGDEAGLIITGRTFAAIAIRRERDGNKILFRSNHTETELSIADAVRCRFFADVSPGGICRFRFAIGEDAPKKIDFEFKATAGFWIGAKVGIYSISRNSAPKGYADFDYFRFSELRVC